jgi:hypothetical protein
MVNSQRPDENEFLSTEPDVEGHMVGLPGTPGLTDDDVEGHEMVMGDRRIDR